MTERLRHPGASRDVARVSRAYRSTRRWPCLDARSSSDDHRLAPLSRSPQFDRMIGERGRLSQDATRNPSRVAAQWPLSNRLVIGALLAVTGRLCDSRSMASPGGDPDPQVEANPRKEAQAHG